MARMARIALDMAIVSVKTVRPVVSRVWSTATAKGNIQPNSAIYKIENTMGGFLDALLERIRALRDQCLPLEEQYLLRQLEIVKKKMQLKGQDDDGRPIF
ncbi:hypothetical protein NE865_05512 [Phthorimaea operculella]|nr:hypothetical protein NE865_05512 [Phthorimaea operculella]